MFQSEQQCCTHTAVHEQTHTHPRRLGRTQWVGAQWSPLSEVTPQHNELLLRSALGFNLSAAALFAHIKLQRRRSNTRLWSNTWGCGDRSSDAGLSSAGRDVSWVGLLEFYCSRKPQQKFKTATNHVDYLLTWFNCIYILVFNHAGGPPLISRLKYNKLLDVITFCKDIHDAQRMNLNHFGDSLTFPAVSCSFNEMFWPLLDKVLLNLAHMFIFPSGSNCNKVGDSLKPGESF